MWIVQLRMYKFRLISPDEGTPSPTPSPAPDSLHNSDKSGQATNSDDSKNLFIGLMVGFGVLVLVLGIAVGYVLYKRRT